VAGISLILALAASGHAQVARVVPGHVVSVTRQLPAVDELPATNRLHLFLGCRCGINLN